MKILSLSACATFALAFAAAAQVPVTPGAIKLGKIQPEGVKTPEYQVQGGSPKRSKNGTWLEIEVEFETKAEEIDEVTFKYTVLIEGKLLDGEVTHVNIPKGREHYSVMYIAPRTLEKLSGGKPFTGASVQNIWVTASKQGQVLDQPVSLRPGAQPNAPHLTGLLLNKNETPFAPLYYDHYEAIKAAK